jgi:hypothetical protein
VRTGAEYLERSEQATGMGSEFRKAETGSDVGGGGPWVTEKHRNQGEGFYYFATCFGRTTIFTQKYIHRILTLLTKDLLFLGY